ncbi:MAG: DEAD/DEAH box helicase family protein [Clostridia bacterium]|nr:DEAD/DEAH box helicase family protein [Clostridia bacterium]
MGVFKDRYNNEKEKQGNTPVSSSSSFRDRYEQERGLNVNGEYINTFFADAGNFLSNTKADENGYNTWKDLSSRAKSIKAWTETNRNTLDEETYKSLNDSISTFESAGEFWNQFETPDDYSYFLENGSLPLRDATWKDLFANSFSRGYQNSLYGVETYKSMFGEANSADAIKETLAQDKYQFETDKWYEKAISGAMEQLGQQWYTLRDPDTAKMMVAGAGTAMLAAGAAGQAGPQVALPEEVVTLPAAALVGLGAGYTSSAAANALEIEAGHAYNEMLELGVSEPTAKAIALGVGGVNAALEVMQVDELVKGFKILNKSGASDTVLKTILKELAKRGISVAKETGQELVQELVTIGGTSLASRFDKGEWAYNAGEIGKRLGETALSSTLSFGAMNVPSATYNITTSIANRKLQNAVNNKNYKEIGTAFSSKVDEVIKAGLESAPESESHKIATQLQEKQEAGEKISDVEIGKAVTTIVVENQNKQTQAEPDTLEKAAMDVVNERNGTQTSKTEPQVTFESDDEQTPAIEETTLKTPENPYMSDTELQSVLEETAREKAIADENANKAAFDAGRQNVPREQVNLTTEAQEEAYTAGRMEHIKNMPSEKNLQNVNENAVEKQYNVSEQASVKPTPETEFDNVLKLGTGFVDGKQRVAEFYSGNPSKAEAIEFLKKEYGIGGQTITLADGTRGYTSHDAKGLKIDNYKGNVRVFSWSEVDEHLRDLVNTGEYGVQVTSKLPASKTAETDERVEKAAKVIQERTGITEEEAVEKATAIWAEIDKRNGRNDTKEENTNVGAEEINTHRGTEASISGNEGENQSENGDGSSVQETVEEANESRQLHSIDRRDIGEQREVSGTSWLTDKANRIAPVEGSELYNAQQAFFKEYGIKCHIIKADAWKRKAPATTYNGEVYVSESIHEDTVPTLLPHEATHAMKQHNFRLYVDFIDDTLNKLNFRSNEAARLDDKLYEHTKINLLDLGSLDEEQSIKYLDELNAFVYGLWKGGIIESAEYDYGWIPDAFNNFDEYIKELSAIHEQFKAERKNFSNKGEINDVHKGILGGESNNDNEVRQSESVPKAEEERNVGAEDRQLGENGTGENGRNVQSSEAGSSAERSDNSGSNDNGVRESDNGNGDSGVGTRGNDNVDELKAKDFSITKAVAEELDTKAPSIDDNLAAIKVLQELEKSGKAPTKAQQGILARFKGWGGLANAFWRYRDQLKEIMTAEEISAAQSTVNDAYFTPTNIIDGVYKALEHLGFEGGNILEPSMGVGNFFGRMPKSIKGNSSLFGVEIDTISGRIAQHLYPSAKIEISPFQDVAYKDGAFDLIIGNVPFGEVKYKYKNNKYLIHDYFFVKAMDKLNDGGVMVFLTSRGTLDKIDQRTRAELARQGKLIAAYRLPSSVFTKSASANVVTDLIIMQKSTTPGGERFTNLGTVDVRGEDFSINEYFVNHPENIIGQLTEKWNYLSKKYDLDVKATGDVAEQLAKAIKKLPKGLLSGAQTVGSVDVTENTAAVQTFTVKENGTVEYIDAQTGDVKQLSGKSADVAKAYIQLNTAYQALIDSTLADAGVDVIESRRKELNTRYDGFVKKYGTLEKNKKVLSADNDFVKLSGLEVYDTKTKSIIKSEMFTKDTLGKRKPKKADSALDALSISIGESGGVSIGRISELTGLSAPEVIKQLEDRIVFTPDGTYELNEVYLSGNVREKYEAVKGKKGFEKNEQMLKDVMPEDIPAKNITPQFGSPWISSNYVADFLSETLHLYRKPTVSYDPTTGTWTISGDTWGDTTLMTHKYGTKYIDAIKLAEKALNMRKIVVKDSEGVVLVGETRAAQQKAEDIKAAFEEWCFKDAKRRQELVTTFNEKFNSHRNMDFSELSKYLTFDGLTDTFKLRDYQKRAVARAIFNGNTLLAHGVGTGKTAEMIAIAMELKRMGIAKKNMMVVPNHKVADFRNDILKMYPSAKVIMLEKGANASQRQRFYAQVAANDFDIVVIPHSSFGMLDVSDDTKTAFVTNQLAELEEVMIMAQQDSGKNVDSRFIRQLETQKKRLEEKLKAITESAKDIGNTFEELGVDSLFVDEAHNFKNLPFYSKLSRVAGVSVNQSNNKTRASRAENMFMITDYLNRNNGRITFGTATPITNSMSEIYNMIRFLRPDILADSGIASFDAWASMFGSIVNQAEVDPSGRKFRMKERFSKFKNVAQMVEQFRRMADILKTGDVIQELPKAERIDVINESNDIQEEFLDIVDEMIDEIRRSGQNAQHNMLEVTTAGQMAAVDLRFVESYFGGKYTRDELNLPNSRIVRVAEKVIKEYNDSNDRKGTQFVFCDVGVREDPGKKYNLHVYGDLINRLVAGGIPREEIAVAQDFEDKAELSARVNTGEIRVLIGSTAVMGEGMNAQNKAVALHHMTVPYRPSDIEQREGRIIRFGNENKDIRIYRYIQEKSYDSYQWQMQERKAAFINQALSGGTVEELEEMSDFQLTAREAKAIASGNPLLLEKIEIEDKLNKLKSLRNKFNTDKLDMKDRLARLPATISKIEQTIADTEADIKTISANETKDFEITFGKTKFTERAEAAKALEKAISKAPRNGSRVLVGSYKGLDLYYSSTIAKGTQYIIKGAREYVVDGGESSLGNITRIINAVEKIPSGLETAKASAKNYKSEIETLKKEVEAEFPQAKALDELQTKLNDIDTQLGINVSEVDMSEVVVGEEDDDTDSFIEGEAEPDSMWSTSRVGENKKPKSLSMIIAEIEHDFGINITTGHIRGKGVLGQYDVKSGGIKTKIANNLPVVSHELGHHFERTFGIKEQLTEEMTTELKSHLEAVATEKYSDEQLIREGVAEYIRRFLQNRETAAIDYPLFTDFFLKCFTAKDLARFEQLADDVNAYYSLDADTATSSIRLREEGGIDLRTPVEKLEDTASAIYQTTVDRIHSIRLFDRATGSNAYMLASNAAYSDAMAGQIITGDLTDKNGQYVSAGLKTVLHGIDLNNKEEYRLFGEYLVVKHGPERLKEGMRVFADDRKNSTAFMERRQAELETQYPQFAEVSERLYDFIKKFYKTWGVNTGLISASMLESWGKRWEYYVPFNRAVEKGKNNYGAKRGFANQNSTVKKAKGGGQDIYNPVDNLIDNIVKMVNAGVRNNVMLAIADSAEKLGADATILEKVPMPLSVAKMDMTGVKDQLTNWLEESDLDEKSKEKAEGVVNNLDDILFQYGRGHAKDTVITVLKNGTPQAWKINDPQLFKSLTSLSPKTMNAVLYAFAVATRFVTATATGLNLGWSLFSNLPRDFATFYTYSKDKNVIHMAKGVGSAYLNKFKVDSASPLYKEFLAMGGGKTSAYTADRKLTRDMRKELARQMSDKKLKKAAKYANPIELLGYASDLIEAGPRFATYKMMREAGMTPQEAFYEAMDVTTNFRRGGELSQFVNMGVPFFNASVQGLDKFRRWITVEELAGKPERKKAIRGRVISYVAVNAALAIIHHVINYSDDEKEEDYEQLSTYTKNSYWVFPIGDGKYFATPKPREIGVLSSFFERCLEYVIGENDHAFDEFYTYASENFLPPIINDLAQIPMLGADVAIGNNIPSSVALLGAFVALAANRDFLGRPIVASGLQNLESKFQYTDRTSKIAYWLGQAFGWSPEKVDYVLQQWFGGFQKTQKALFPVGEKNRDWTLGVGNTYVKDNQYSTDLVNWLYDRADTTERAKNSDPNNTEKAIAAKWDSFMTEFYGTYYGKAKEDSKSTAARGTRQLVLDMIREYQKGIDGEYKTEWQKAVEAVCIETGSTEYLPSVMQGEVKDGKGEKHDLSDVQYVEYQTDYLRLYWEIVEETMSSNMSTDDKAEILTAAKNVARERALERTLQRIGAPTYEDEDSIEAEQFGINTKLYITATVEMDNIKADKDQDGKSINGSRREKIERYLNSVCNSYKEYLFLLGIEYESVKDDPDYIAYFGK